MTHESGHKISNLQIKETFERIQRQKKEKEQEAATNPISHISVELDASGLCYSNRETYITELFNIPINSFVISQSVDVSLSCLVTLCLLNNALFWYLVTLNLLSYALLP